MNDHSGGETQGKHYRVRTEGAEPPSIRDWDARAQPPVERVVIDRAVLQRLVTAAACHWESVWFSDGSHDPIVGNLGNLLLEVADRYDLDISPCGLPAPGRWATEDAEPDADGPLCEGHAHNYALALCDVAGIPEHHVDRLAVALRQLGLVPLAALEGHDG